MKLDAHQHFWRLSNPFTQWPTRELAPIYRDFGPDDLRGHLSYSGVTGSILVQAAPDLEETKFLLDVASQNSFVKGVVGWVDFAHPAALSQLDDLASNPLLRGVRPMIQAIRDRAWILRREFSPIFEALRARKLSFDALVRADQICEIAELAQRHPQLPIVLDHCGKPDIARGAFRDWAVQIEKLAQYANVHCKISGLWTEAGGYPTLERIRPYVDHVSLCFGARRLIWGSDWPVLELAGAYPDWLLQCETMFASHDDADKLAIFGQNGMRFYGLTSD